ncbi:MAG: hypothetical protein EOP84_03325 [Verrucomicrobiaceae bacterium]|nr:MAG: hypothetical protein EOP84_03325 [Verrucomicrobiaceae bacterium]
MKLSQVLLTLLFATSVAVAAAPDRFLLYLLSDLEKLTRLTEKRLVMRAEYSDLCAPVDLPDHARLLGKRDGESQLAAIHIYVTREGEAAFRTPEAKFPVGTIVLKQKFSSPEAKEAEFYTGMRKREKGYNPDCGDWEFFTMNADRRAFTAQGRIDSCMDCHRTYAKTDFITKRLR